MCRGQRDMGVIVAYILYIGLQSRKVSNKQSLLLPKSQSGSIDALLFCKCLVRIESVRRNIGRARTLILQNEKFVLGVIGG